MRKRSGAIPGYECGPRRGPLDQPIRPTHAGLGARFHIAVADHALGCIADIGRPRGHHLVECPAMGTEEFSGRTHSPFLAHENRSEEHTSELQSHLNLVCRLLLEKKKRKKCQPKAQYNTLLRIKRA